MGRSVNPKITELNINLLHRSIRFRGIPIALMLKHTGIYSMCLLLIRDCHGQMQYFLIIYSQLRPNSFIINTLDGCVSDVCLMLIRV